MKFSEENLQDEKTRDESLYRLGVGIMIINKNRKILSFQRGSNDKDTGSAGFWQMPQGGVEKEDENYYATALRELKEETGINAEKVKLIDSMPYLIYYILPESYRHKLWQNKYIGQKQHWYLFEFLGNDNDVNLPDDPNEEFINYEWLEPDELIRRTLYFKVDSYKKIFDFFSKYLS